MPNTRRSRTIPANARPRTELRLQARLQLIKNHIRSNPAPENCNAGRVATLLTDDTRGHNAMLRAIRVLVDRGQLKCTANVDGWVNVLSLPEEVTP